MEHYQSDWILKWFLVFSSSYRNPHQLEFGNFTLFLYQNCKTWNLWNCKHRKIFNPLRANPTKWSNTLKQFVGKLPTNCLSVFDHCVGLVLKELKLGHFSILCMKGLNKKFLTIWFKKQNIFAAIQCLQINNNNNFDQRIANNTTKTSDCFW